MRKQLFIFAIFTSLLISAMDVTIPYVEQHWIKPDVLTKQGSTPWSFAAVFHGFQSLTKQGQDAEIDTQTRLWHDGSKLYFGFFRTVAEKSVCNNDKHDSDIWADDCVSLYIAPNPAELNRFYQIDINANGIVYDALVIDKSYDTKFELKSLKLNIFKGERGWLLYASVDMSELSLAPGKKFLLNLSAHRREGAEDEYSTWSPLSQQSFAAVKEFTPATISENKQIQGTPADYTYSKYPELVLDGEGEFGTNERWIRRNGASISHWYKHSGINALSLNCKKPATSANYFHRIAIKPNELYLLSFFGRYSSLETPNMVPIRIHCFNADGKEIATIDGPGLGNLGGGAPNPMFTSYRKEFKTPEGTAYGELETRLDCEGSVQMDAISVKKYVRLDIVPTPLFPKENDVLFNPNITFQWKLFTRDTLRPGTLTLQVSTSPDFPADGTLTFDECAYDPAAKGWDETVPGNGIYYWRCRFDGEYGGKFSTAVKFTVNCTPANEKIPPVVDGLSPRGRMPQRAPEYKIAFHDPGISSGIAKVQLRLNRIDVTANAKVTDNQITFQLPEDGKTFYEVQCCVTDNNGNSFEENDFIAILPGKGIVSIDSKGFLTLDGKRFFPTINYAIMDPQDYPFFAKFGYSANMSPWVTPVNPSLWQLVGDATRAGVTTMPIVIPEFLWGKGFVKSNTRAAKRFLEPELKACAKLVGHPGVFGFYLGDESIDAGYRMDVYQEFYARIHEAVPEFPCFWLPTFGQSNKFAWEGAVKACDMLIHDDYVINRNDHLFLYPDIQRIMGWTNNMPFLDFLGAHAPGNDWNKKIQRFPPLKDMRFTNWVAIIAGAKGLAVYQQSGRKALHVNQYADTNVPEHGENIGKLMLEIRQYEKYLISDEEPAQKTKVISGKALLMERVCDGKTFTAAVNLGEAPAVIRFPDGKEETLERIATSLRIH